VVLLLSISMSGCGAEKGAATAPSSGQEKPSAAPAAQPLRIAAASDLQLALPRLAKAFQDATGIEVSSSFLASGQLAAQIEQGAPFDVFMAANQTFVRDLASGGFITADSVQPYANGSLVLAVFRELGPDVGGLSDLANPAVKKIALAQPETAPYGKAGKQALERAGLWETLKPKIVFAESVRQALLYAQKGDAEVALVGRALAGVPEVVTVDVDRTLYDPIVQALGIVAASKRPADGRRFAAFVLSDRGQAILKEFGFSPPALNGPKQ
jgi:molybdate transport system substrate-binding protein